MICIGEYITFNLLIRGSFIFLGMREGHGLLSPNWGGRTPFFVVNKRIKGPPEIPYMTMWLLQSPKQFLNTNINNIPVIKFYTDILY